MVANNKNYKLVIFGNGQIAEEAYNYFQNDSEYEVVGFVVDDKFIKKNKFMGKILVPISKLKSKFPSETHKIFVDDNDVPDDLITLHLWETFSLKYLNKITDWQWSQNNINTLYGKLLSRVLPT